MNHPTFPHLFSPIEIRGKEIRNRIFVPGHNTALSEGGRIGDAMLAYHKARMKGGVGMIMTEVHCVHETYMPAGRAWATTDDCLPGLCRLARLGRDHGVRVIGQVFYPGRVAAASIDGTKMTAWAPSAVPDEMYKSVPVPPSIPTAFSTTSMSCWVRRRPMRAGSTSSPTCTTRPATRARSPPHSSRW